MDVKRVSTTNKSKKVVRILLIITGILGIALIGVAIYFYAIGDASRQTNNAEVTCGCYYIDPAVISECGDTKRAFKFNLQTTTTDQTCQAQCSTNELSTNLLNSTTEQDLYQICRVSTLTDVRCNAMVIKDKDGKIVTGKVSNEDELNIEATFDDEYTNPLFIVNNQNTDPDVISTDKKTISKKISDLSNKTTLEIVATATDSTGENINSIVCRRLVEIEQSGEENVNAVSADTTTVNDVVKVSSVDISIGNLSSDTGLSLIFTFSDNIPSLTMTKGFTVDTTKGEISIVQSDLYDSDNFTQSSSFSSLDSEEGEITMTTEVRKSSTSFGTASTIIDLESETTDSQDSNSEEERSNFTVDKTGTPECVERVSPDNSAEFTITTTNSGTTSQGITSIKDKLPLGFTYTEDSTKINGVSVDDDDYIEITEVGNTQELVWSKATPWTISGGQTLTIVFESTADTNALTGTNQNEVIVTPEQIPEDPTSVRASFDIVVAQDCDDPDTTPVNTDDDDTDSTPQTGLFDTTIGRIVLGLVTVIFGWIIYTQPIGQQITHKLLSSGIYNNAEVTTWKIFKPKKYFEHKTVEKLQKKKK
jgi:uncharacterized repeat protein (TIGR01451 family)